MCYVHNIYNQFCWVLVHFLPTSRMKSLFISSGSSCGPIPITTAGCLRMCSLASFLIH